jgi:hypothetical protein
MANGNAALLLLAPESTPAGVTTGKPNEVERSIGQATAAATTALCQAMQEYQNGGLRPETRLASGTRVAALYQLQQAHAGALDFAATVRREGKRVLRQYFDGDFHQHYSAEQGDAVLDLFIDEVLAVVAKVASFERAWVN